MGEYVQKDAEYKSYAWANNPVIAESMFREYDLRSATVRIQKRGTKVEPGINADGMRILGQAYGTYVRRQLKQRRIVVGNDYRSYSRGMAFAFITGALSSGVDVIDIGVVLTPVLYFAQHHLKLPAGAMVTASHNDNGWCGLKLAKGLSSTFEPADILSFKRLVYDGPLDAGSGRYERFDVREAYLKDVTARCLPFVQRQLKVVVSTANGGAEAFLPDALRRLGFSVAEVNSDLDWDFPKFNPNTEDVRFLKELGLAIKRHKADLGVGADGDGDRLGVVDERGEIIFSDRAGLFLARSLCEKVPGKPVVIDVKSTGAVLLDPVLRAHRAPVVFCKTGHSYVKAKAKEVDALIGFEKSGHVFLRQGFGLEYDDGCLAACLFAATLSSNTLPLSALIAEQPRSHQSPTMEPAVANDTVKYEIVEKVTREILELQKRGGRFAGKKIVDVITLNGVRVVLEDGSWGLVRASSNKPVLVVVCESFSEKKLLYTIFEALQKILEKHGVKKKDYDQLLPPLHGRR